MLINLKKNNNTYYIFINMNLINDLIIKNRFWFIRQCINLRLLL